MMAPVWFEAAKALKEEASDEDFKTLVESVSVEVFATARFVCLKGKHCIAMAEPQAYIIMKANANTAFIEGRLISPMDALKLAKALKIEPRNLILKFP